MPRGRREVINDGRCKTIVRDGGKFLPSGNRDDGAGSAGDSRRKSAGGKSRARSRKSRSGITVPPLHGQVGTRGFRRGRGHVLFPSLHVGIRRTHGHETAQHPPCVSVRADFSALSRVKECAEKAPLRDGHALAGRFRFVGTVHHVHVRCLQHPRFRRSVRLRHGDRPHRLHPRSDAAVRGKGTHAVGHRLSPLWLFRGLHPRCVGAYGFHLQAHHLSIVPVVGGNLRCCPGRLLHVHLSVHPFRRLSQRHGDGAVHQGYLSHLGGAYHRR